MEYKRVYAEINLDHIAHNMALIRRMVPQPTKIMAVVKANGYGHGALEVSKAALYNGADCLGVAICEEGVWLRENNIFAPILILGYSPEPLLDQVIRHDLIQTVFSVETAAALSNAALRRAKKARVHIKIDTGMSRLGFLPGEKSVEEIISIMTLPGLEVTGIYTHFAQSDPQDQSFTAEQHERFQKFLAALSARGVTIPNCHISNSAAILNHENYRMDTVRAGIILYGLAPSAGTDVAALSLKPAMSLKTQISLIKPIERGVSVGYGRTYFTQRDTVVATVPVGYADGFSRHMARGGRVLIGGAFADVIGAVCMDQFMIDVTRIKGVKAGDEVVLLGRQGENEITADELARIQDTISYEIVCGIGKRVPRVFYKNNQPLRTEEY